MSLDKIKNSKHQRNIDGYSKNTILNSLIKQKLENEMAVVKENVATIIKKEDSLPRQQSQSRIKIKRQKSFNITPQKIQESLSYNPITRLKKVTEQFVSQRQNQSNLIPVDMLSTIHQARHEPQILQNKFQRNDKLQYKKMNSIQELKDLSSQIKSKTIKEFSEDVWLPSQPELTHLIQNKRQSIQFQSLSQKSNSIREFVDAEENKFSNQLLGTSYLKKQVQAPPLIIRKQSNPQIMYKTVTYEPSRYHKDDYKLLEDWLDSSLNRLGAETKLSIEQRLNMFYSTYVCGWKELIRLTYIESADKALLMEKMFYSMLRLFTGIIGEEHRNTKNFYAQNEQELKEINKMMQNRMRKLQAKYDNVSEQMDTIKEHNHMLSVGFLSYEKINKELVEELQETTKEKNRLKRQVIQISNAFFKSLENLHEKGSIEADENPNDEYKSYYFLKRDNKPFILGRFKQKIYQQNNEKEKEEIADSYDRYGKKIKKIQNQLNTYWLKKEDDLELKLLVASRLTNKRFKSTGEGTDPIFTNEAQIQAQEPEEYSTEGLLKKQKQQLESQFQKQKKVLQQKIREYEVNLGQQKKKLEEQKQRNQELNEVNAKYKEESERLKQNLNQAKSRNESLKEERVDLINTISNRQSQITSLTQEIEEKDTRFSSLTTEYNKFDKVLSIERQNNQLLVKESLQLKQKHAKLEAECESIVGKLKNAAPWIEKLLEEIDSKGRNEEEALNINMNLLQTVCQKIQEYLGDFVERDSGLFMTKLT